MSVSTTSYWDARISNQIILVLSAINPSLSPMVTASLTNVNHIMILAVSLVSVASILPVTNPAKRYRTDVLRQTKEYVWNASLISNS